MKQRLLGMALVLTMAAGMVFTAQAEDESAYVVTEEVPAVNTEDGVKFCTIISNSSDYCKAEQAGAEALAAELGIEHMTLQANSDAQKEIDAIQSAISQNVDGMFIHDVDITALGPSVQAALDAGIQVSCSSAIRNYLDEAYVNHPLLFPIYWDEYEMGLIMGQMISEKMGGEGKVLIIGGNVGQNASEQRIAGYKDAFAEFEGIEIVNTIACDFDRALAMTATEDALTANPDITCIASVGEEMAWGIVEALENLGRDDIWVSTADGSKVTMQMCIDGKIHVIGQEKAAGGARAGISILNARVNGDPIEEATGFFDFASHTCSAEMAYFDQSNADLEQCDY